MSSNYIFILTRALLLTQLSLLFACTPSEKPKSKPRPVSHIQFLINQVKEKPNYDNHVNLGFGFAKLGRSQDALNLYHRALRINPKAPLAWNNICAELNSQRRFTEGAKFCRKALLLNPKYKLAKKNLRFSLSQSKKISKNLKKRMRRALRSKRTKGQTLIDLGMDVYSVNDLKGSITIWSRIKRRDPLYATAQNNIASSYILLKKFISADAAIMRALKLEPSNQRFLNNRKWLQKERSKKKK